MKKLLVLALVAMSAAVVQADLVAEWSFSSNLNDTAAGGSTADNLVGMMQYGGNGTYDRSFTNYKTDGTTEVLPSCVQAPTYEAGLVGAAVRIGVRGVYNYTSPNTYPNASTYQVPTAGATYLTTNSDPEGSDLDALNTFTMEGFFKADAMGGVGGLGEFAYTRLLTKWVSGFNQSYHFTVHNGVLEVIQKNSSNVNVTVADDQTLATLGIEAGKWFHTAVTGNGTTLTLWLNGVAVASGTYNGTMYDSTSPFWVGGRLDIPNPVTNNNGFIGLVDEVRIWNEAKDADYMAARAALVPEPATLALFGLGCLSVIRRKRG